ncbi:unnamed protein product [Acanthoscelides obtectus]|uniref:Uncharacterized protein n=1 Tax=Acanthoscelides obtectus TaxID=200917 RepID=A0A9P0NTH8_ACAOB|nr:unnamed protein product [Acanthoscelides obtectus]CAK1667902.1 hypothetical protein AOBTE_LOCUS26101 [Acanthoscelides obtectus]
MINAGCLLYLAIQWLRKDRLQYLSGANQGNYYLLKGPKRSCILRVQNFAWG